jgi:hypothetical protein
MYDEFLTGELFLPSRTVNQYLARYWFAVPITVIHPFPGSIRGGLDL